ncbi:MAG: hypothetical protein FWB86_03310 [Treponema sp.]|nr:hypothetical protein [Treponema sp.]MCL2251185.1 hypothetical protein [Treponema sp.]
MENETNIEPKEENTEIKTQADNETNTEIKTETKPDGQSETLTDLTKSNKPKKPVKIPRIFKKPIKKKRFEKRFAHFIEHPSDKKFFIECFTLKKDEKENEVYAIKENLTKEEVKKLNGLIKVIKANQKGPINFIPLLAISIIGAAIVFFFIIFANPLLETAMEKGLEAIFEAKSDVDDLRLSLIKFEIAISGITVANRDSPMTNLFQMSKTRIKLKPDAVLRGKIYIEEIRADSIRFGTERKTSGAIPLRPKKEKPPKPPRPESPPLVDLKNFDAMALLNQEYDKLSTPKLYDLAINTYNETVSKWQKQVDDTKKQIEQLRASSAPLLSTNINNIRDIDAIRKTIQDLNTVYIASQSAVSHASSIVSGIEADFSLARTLETNARNAITDDINHLKSYIDLGSGAAFGVIEPIIRDMLSDSAEQYIEYGLAALEALEKIKQMSAEAKKKEKPKKVPKVVFKGRDVSYPVASYPAFYLGTMASDFLLDTWKWDFDLRNISSSPDLTNQPITLKLGVSEQGSVRQKSVVFNGSADLRSNPQDRFIADVNAKGFPVTIGNQLKEVGIDGLSGDSNITVNITGKPDGGFSAGGDVKIESARLINPSGIIAEAVNTAIIQAGSIDLGLQYIHYINQTDVFKITTNIGDLFAQALRNTASAYAEKAKEEIERVLRKKIDEYIDGRFGSKEDIDKLLNIAKGDKTAIDQITNEINNKKNEYEQRLRTLAGGVIDEATRQAEEAAQRAKEEADRLAEEAAKKAKEEADRQAQQLLQNVPRPSLPSWR